MNPPETLGNVSEELREAIEEEVSLAIHRFHAAQGAVVINPFTSEATDNILALIASELVKAREDMTKLLEWATGDYDGVSSQAILRHMCGLQANHWGFMPPSDRSDRGRCIRLLNLMPEWWNRLDEMTKYHGWADQIKLIRNEGEHLTANKKEAGNGS